MQVEVAHRGPFGLAEGIVWSSEQQCLYWVDIVGKKLFRGDASGEAVTSWTMPTEVGFCAPHASGGIIVGLNTGFALFDPETENLTQWVEPEPDRQGNRFNDASVDREGRLWAGTMPLAGPGEDPEGSLYRLDSPSHATLISDGFWIQNGMAFSPDGHWGYVSDSVAHIRKIWRFALDPETGEPGPRDLFFDTNSVAGRPDGATVDADGFYWMAGVDGWQILRLTPDGEIDMEIPLPVKRPTKMAFGGRELDTLFVTTMGPEFGGDTPPEDQPLAGSILALSPGVSGIATPPVACGG